MKKTLRTTIIIPWFGDWEPWHDAFFISCRENPSMDWIIPTDAEFPSGDWENIHFLPYSIDEFNRDVLKKLGFNPGIRHPYKLCDFKPAFGLIFSELLKNYDYWGYGDMDLIYGNIKKFYPDELLESYDIITPHTEFVPAHFCLLKNSDYMINLFKEGGAYKSRLLDPKYTGFDEQILSQFIDPDPSNLNQLVSGQRSNHMRSFRRRSIIKKIVPSGLRLKVGGPDDSEAKDFSSIANRVEKNGEIRIYRKLCFESDLMLEKRGIYDWSVSWNDGTLLNRKGSEILYFHFILSKNEDLFTAGQIPAHSKQINISPSGIKSIEDAG